RTGSICLCVLIQTTKEGCHPWLRGIGVSPAGSVALAWVTGAGRRNRLVHDAADGARAAAALDAAAEATIDRARGARRLFGTDRGAHVVVSQHVARTDNHGSSPIAGGLVRYATSIHEAGRAGKTKRRFCSNSI